MMMPQELPVISEGATTLFAIALEKDARKQLTRNRALELALDYLARLPSDCRRGPNSVAQLLGLAALPTTLFRFLAEFLNAIDSQIDRREQSSEERKWEHSEYDHPVLLAVGQTLGHVAGMSQGKGPELAVALKRLGEVTPLRLHHRLLQNYFGNVLHDYFDACEVRRQVRNLPDDVESNLRNVDAKAMSDWVVAKCNPGDAGLDAATLNTALSDLMTGLFLKDARHQ